MQLTVNTERYSTEFRVYQVVTDEKWNQNCYLIVHLPTTDIILIDPGCRADEIIRAIAELGGSLKRILITHPHHDHIGAAAKISEYYHVPCELHKNDERLLKHAPMYALKFAGKQLTPPTSYVCFDNQLEPSGSKYSIAAFHAPGHTKGGTCYILDRIIFSGDTLLYKEFGRTDLPGGDRDTILKSVKELLAHVPDDALLLPGHGRAWTVAEAKIWWSELSLDDLAPE